MVKRLNYPIKDYSEGILKDFPDLDVDIVDPSYLNRGYSKLKILPEKPKPFDWESDPDYSSNNQLPLDEDSELRSKLEKINRLLSSEILFGDFNSIDQRTLLNYLQEGPIQDSTTQQS